jgi:hypothetical protein
MNPEALAKSKNKTYNVHEQMLVELPPELFFFCTNTSAIMYIFRKKLINMFVCPPKEKSKFYSDSKSESASPSTTMILRLKPQHKGKRMDFRVNRHWISSNLYLLWF